MSWWIVCCHTWAHRKRHLHLVVRWPGGPRISPHIPFSTISMVRKMYFNISLSHIRLISVATKWLSHRPTNRLATLLQFQVAREKCAFPWWNRLHQKPSSRLVPSLLVHLPGKLWATVQPVSAVKRTFFMQHHIRLCNQFPAHQSPATTCQPNMECTFFPLLKGSEPLWLQVSHWLVSKPGDCQQPLATFWWMHTFLLWPVVATWLPAGL